MSSRVRRSAPPSGDFAAGLGAARGYTGGMIADLIRRLTAAPSPEPLPEEDARIAMAALMVRVARTDDHYTSGERDRIDRVLAESYGLDGAAARALRGEGEAAEANAPDTVRFDQCAALRP
jgi:uncharacterized tellurite resistance protein B-like protein